MNVPRKRGGGGAASGGAGGAPSGSGVHEKALTRFFEAVLAALLRVVDFAVVKAVILASPAFVKDDFFAFMMAEAARRDLRAVADNRSRFILAHAASGHKRALQSVFLEPTVLAQLSHTRAAEEVVALQVRERERESVRECVCVSVCACVRVPCSFTALTQDDNHISASTRVLVCRAMASRCDASFMRIVALFACAPFTHPALAAGLLYGVSH